MRSLDDPITMLAGVGEKRAASLASLGIQTIEDLLTYYPFRYEDIQERKGYFERNRSLSSCDESIWL